MFCACRAVVSISCGVAEAGRGVKTHPDEVLILLRLALHCTRS